MVGCAADSDASVHRLQLAAVVVAIVVPGGQLVPLLCAEGNAPSSGSMHPVESIQLYAAACWFREKKKKVNSCIPNVVVTLIHSC